MDQRLISAAQTGNLDALYELLREDPFLLQKIDTIPFSQTPLHVAVSARQPRFAREIATLKPSFTTKLDEDGFSPIHLAAASATEQAETVKDLLAINSNLLLLKGRERRTPLHCAAVAGNTEVIQLLLNHHPQCIVDLTARNETVFHLAVKGEQMGALGLLIELLEKAYEVEVDSCALQITLRGHGVKGVEGIRGLIRISKLFDKEELRAAIYSCGFRKKEVEDFTLIREALKGVKKEEVLNWKDDEGNTVLHLAALRKQRPIIKMLLGGITAERKIRVDVNSKNADNLTALDILMQLPRDKEVDQIKDILLDAGAVSASQIISPPPTATNIAPNLNETIKLRGRPDSRDMHNGLLVFSLFISIACFLTAVYPPGGVWQDDYNNITDNSTTIALHKAGIAILATRPYLYFSFIICNVMGFLPSLAVISALPLPIGSPFTMLKWLTLASVLGAYTFSIILTMPDDYLPSVGKLFGYFAIVIVTYSAKMGWIYYKKYKASATKDDYDEDAEKRPLIVTHDNVKE